MVRTNRKKKKNLVFKIISHGLYRYVDLIQMVQPDYSDDHIIVLLLKEMEEFADVNLFFYDLKKTFD